MGHANRMVLFASTNPHKVDEVRAILRGNGIEVVGLDGVPLSPAFGGPRHGESATSPARGEGGKKNPSPGEAPPSPARGEGGEKNPSPGARTQHPPPFGEREADCLPEPEENADTFEGNAAIKALYYARATGMVCLADDSGLEVDALGGRPGVFSARYAGIGSSRAERDAANNAKLLKELVGVPEGQRAARFVCAMVLAEPPTPEHPEGRVVATTRGTFEGRIGFAARGTNGFGYDPLLVVEDGRTSAELTPEEKNGRSHRGEAARKMAEHLG